MIAPTSFFADYGCHVRILEEARVLQKMGHRVTVATYANGRDVEGIRIERTIPIPWRGHYEVGSSRHKILFDALLGAKITAMLTTRRFDLLHAHLHEGALLALGLGWIQRLPMLFDFQGSMTEEMIDHGFVARDSKAYSGLRRLEQWLNRRAPVLFTNSRNAHRHLVDEFGVNPRRLRALPDCVNAEEFVPASEHPPAALAALRTRIGIPAGHRVIVYLGLLAEYQGTSHLLEAFARLRARHKNLTLLLMGFPGVDTYRHKALALGVAEDVIFTGRVAYAEAPLHLALGHVAVAPKLSLTEGAGKLLNYMAVGLPTVAFDTPVAREYLGDEGLFAERGNVDALADELERALHEVEAVDGALTPRGVALRARAAEHFDWRHAGDKIVEAYAQLVDGTPPAFEPTG